MTYLINTKADTSFISGNGETIVLDIKLIERALDDVHKIIKLITDYIPVDIFGQSK